VLLRRLAVALGRPVAVDTRVDAVRGDRLPRIPNDRLSVLVSRLRGVLGIADAIRPIMQPYRPTVVFLFAQVPK
jgi:hypothetical protein